MLSLQVALIRLANTYLIVPILQQDTAARGGPGRRSTNDACDRLMTRAIAQ